MKNVSTDKRRDQVREYIDRYWVRHKSAPSIRDIKQGVGLSSTSLVFSYVRKLAEFGYLVPIEPSLSRQIMPVWVREAIGVAAAEMFGGDHDSQQMG